MKSSLRLVIAPVQVSSMLNEGSDDTLLTPLGGQLDWTFSILITTPSWTVQVTACPDQEDCHLLLIFIYCSVEQCLFTSLRTRTPTICVGTMSDQNTSKIFGFLLQSHPDWGLASAAGSSISSSLTESLSNTNTAFFHSKLQCCLPLWGSSGDVSSVLEQEGGGSLVRADHSLQQQREP